MRIAMGITTWIRPASLALVVRVAYATLIYTFFYLPILVIVVFAFDSKTIPGLPLRHLTMSWFAQALVDAKLLASLWASLWIAFVTACLSILIGMPAAMVLAWHDLHLKPLFFAVILAPIVIPHIMIGIGLLLLFRLAPELIGPIGVVIAHTTITLCFATLLLYSRLLGFRRSYIEAAMDLGASEIRVLWEVILPLSIPALLAVFLLSFTESFGEFVAAWLVSGFMETLPIAIWTSLRLVLSPKINAIASLVIIVSIVLSAVAQAWIIRQMRPNAQW
jgi:ABC-type spermidine/putrescine transport system permease subunit II